MGWIENRPNKFLNQNFVHQGPPAKCKTRRFRFISLILRQNISLFITITTLVKLIFKTALLSKCGQMF